MDSNNNVNSIDSNNVRPWVRYWARYIDMYLIIMLILILQLSIFPNKQLDEKIAAIGVYFIWILFEAQLMSTWGTTPGKWLLRISVRDSEGNKLTLKNALIRSFLVWFVGLGMTLLTPITEVISYVPSVRVVDTFYEDGAFYIVTYAKSQKVIEMQSNEKVALCKNLYRFSGTAHLLGHPLKDENKNIRSKLIEVFSSWYFEHNNENDENMCYVKIELDSGFFYKDGVGYKVDFKTKTAEEFPFDFDIFTID